MGRAREQYMLRLEHFLSLWRVILLWILEKDRRLLLLGENNSVGKTTLIILGLMKHLLGHYRNTREKFFVWRKCLTARLLSIVLVSYRWFWLRCTLSTENTLRNLFIWALIGSRIQSIRVFAVFIRLRTYWAWIVLIGVWDWIARIFKLLSVLKFFLICYFFFCLA